MKLTFQMMMIWNSKIILTSAFSIFLIMALKILQWNLNGFFNNLHELQILVREHSPDVIALQETHITQNAIKIIGYTTIMENNPAISHCNTVLLIKNNIKIISENFQTTSLLKLKFL